MLEDKYFLADLVVLELIDSDVILWMDWLLANFATLDYKNKGVKLED